MIYVDELVVPVGGPEALWDTQQFRNVSGSLGAGMRSRLHIHAHNGFALMGKTKPCCIFIHTAVWIVHINQENLWYCD
jgi:hypothetical protein